MPSFNIAPEWFAFRLEDVLLPIVVIIILYNRCPILNSYTKFILFFGAYILVTIFINNRFAFIRDYFEIYKVIKYLFYFLFFMLMIQKYRYHRPLMIIFYIVFYYIQIFCSIGFCCSLCSYAEKQQKPVNNLLSFISCHYIDTIQNRIDCIFLYGHNQYSYF